MFTQLFGNYLVEQSIITAQQRDAFQKELLETRVKMGTIAVADGLLTEAQADEINHAQTQQDRRFGDIAVDLGYLTDAQVSSLLGKQGDVAMKFYQLLTDHTTLSMDEIMEHLNGFQRVHGFTDEELEALKKDDFDAIIPLFATVKDAAITDLAGLVMRNLTRFVTSDFYFGRMKKATDYSYSMLGGQKAVGDFGIYVGFGASKELDGIIKLAKGYAKGITISGSDEVYDAVCEFANLNNGLLASTLSQNNTALDMLPPEVYLNQKLSGNAYYMPVYIQGSEFDLIISTDSNFAPGENPHALNISKTALNTDAESSLPRVLVVDDSALIRKILIKLLNENGYNVVAEGTNGAEGVELYKEVKPDLVTLDITMPVMDGVEALKNIKKFDQDAKVVMISAAGQKDKLMEALKSGAELFITKPFSEPDVLKSLKSMK